MTGIRPIQIFRAWFYLIGLTLKAPIMTAADDTHKYFFIVFRENKT